jgi:hypothetical protein
VPLGIILGIAALQTLLITTIGPSHDVRRTEQGQFGNTGQRAAGAAVSYASTFCLFL